MCDGASLEDSPKKAGAGEKRKYRREHVLNGLCRDCSKPIYKSSLCEYHYTKHKERVLKRYNKLKEDGVCYRCLKPRSDEYGDGNVYCKWCSDLKGAAYMLMRKQPM